MINTQRFYKFCQILLKMEEFKYQNGTIALEFYRVIQFLTRGTWGLIYQVQDIRQGKRYAMKVVTSTLKIHNLQEEALMLKQLQSVHNIAKVHNFKRQFGHDHLIMDLYGQSLQEYFEEQGNKLDCIDILQIAEKLLLIIKEIHQKGFIHRDIKPQNILFGVEKQHKNEIYLVDFGVCQKYIQNGKHSKYKQNKKLVGTFIFCSLNTCLAIKMSRRDDIQRLANTLIYLAKGTLPWYKSTKLQEFIQLRKDIQSLCQGIHPFFKYLMTYSRKLEFQERPDYQKLGELIQQSIKELKK